MDLAIYPLEDSLALHHGCCYPAPSLLLDSPLDRNKYLSVSLALAKEKLPCSDGYEKDFEYKKVRFYYGWHSGKGDYWGIRL